ncbi:MAG TPA: hypothetical protein VMN60_11090 [Longimicrobiales bacterium]|nr:hypothetical protein [Longimicrobiales bacterium]
MMKFRNPTFTALALALACTGTARAQDAPDTERLRVFVDCAYCDTDFLRTELTWVDYMRDRADAHVHVLVTRQSTGGGGGRYTLEFIGLRDHAGRTDTLHHVATADDTPDIIRRGLTRRIKLGLVPFVAGTAAARDLDVTVSTAVRAPGAPGTDPAQATATAQRDPWNFWSFTVGVNGFSSGESQQNFQNFSGRVSANRTTEAWKLNFNVSNSYGESTFEYTINDELKKTTSINRSYNASSLVVRSVTPHFSIGGRANASSSTFGNNALSFNFAPAVEYNFVPYAESTRRSITMQYSAGMRHAKYKELTIFDELSETRPVHTLALNYSTRQPWGNISVGVDGSQFLHDTDKYSAGISGSTSLRLVRGLSFNIGGNYRHVRDQLSIPKRNLTEEQILLRQRQLATSYYYFFNFGLSYRFGSIFNNVVNTRMGGGGGGEMFFMM